MAAQQSGCRFMGNVLNQRGAVLLHPGQEVLVLLADYRKVREQQDVAAFQALAAESGARRGGARIFPSAIRKVGYLDDAHKFQSVHCTRTAAFGNPLPIGVVPLAQPA